MRGNKRSAKRVENPPGLIKGNAKGLTVLRTMPYKPYGLDTQPSIFEIAQPIAGVPQ